MRLSTFNASALVALGAVILISSIANALPPRTPFGASLVTTSANPLATLVDPRNNPDWAGLFNSNDCKQAITLMKRSVVQYNAREILIFWSNKWIIRPPAENTFELPWISHSGTCVILFRIAKDFGDNVLPFDEGYAHLSSFFPIAWSSWAHIFTVMDDLVDLIIKDDHGRLGWQSIINRNVAAIALVLPKNSQMSRMWAGFGTDDVALSGSSSSATETSALSRGNETSLSPTSTF
ncbi:MAG: hypothetical protein Q9171_002976 [Xanthocarpia ochracea]